MSHHLNFDSHIIIPQPCHADTGPDWVMIWHPALEVANHRSQSLIIDWDMVRVNSEYLLPTFSACIFQVQVDVGKSLVDLLIDLFEVNASLGVPAT